MVRILWSVRKAAELSAKKAMRMSGMRAAATAIEDRGQCPLRAVSGHRTKSLDLPKLSAHVGQERQIRKIYPDLLMRDVAGLYSLTFNSEQNCLFFRKAHRARYIDSASDH